MADSVLEARRYLLVNLASNLLGLVMVAGVELWLTRFLIAELGLPVYGLIPLVVSIIAYAGLVSLSISGSVGRFVALSMDQGDVKHGNIYFNSGFFGTLLTGLLMLAVAGLSMPLAIKVLDIPPGYTNDFIILFILIILASVLGAVGSPFQVSTFINNRFYLQNIANSISKFVKAAIIVIGFSLAEPYLATVGIGYLVMSLVLLLASIWFSQKLTPCLSIKARYFHWPALREMTGMGKWIVLDQIGTLLYLNTDLIVINLLLGSEQVGLYAPILQILLLIQLLAPALSEVFAPVAIDMIARNELGILSAQTQRAIKFLGLGLALPVGLVCGFSEPLLRTWLGSSFVEVSPILWILVAPQVLFLAIVPLYNINRGLNKVKVPALFTVIGGVANLAISVTLVRFFDLGLYGVAIGTLISFSLRSICFLPVYTARCLGEPGGSFVRPVASGILMVSIISLLCLILVKISDIADIADLAIAMIGSSAVFIGVSFVIFLNKDERRLIYSLLRLN